VEGLGELAGAPGGLDQSDQDEKRSVTALPVRDNRKTFFPNEPWFLSRNPRHERTRTLLSKVL